MTFEFPMRADASLLVGVALLIAGCSRPSSSALKPIDQAALQTMVDTTAKELLVPGAVVLLRTPQGEFTVTHGTTRLGTMSPPRADTHFRIASNTKSMTAAVIVLLAQEGKLSLDDPVSKYVPSVPNGDNITIDELLRMRSGLYNYTDAPALAELPAWYRLRIQQHQLHASRPHRRAGRWQATGPGDAGPVVRAAGDARHFPPRSHFEHHSRSLLPRLPIRQLLICSDGHAVPARHPSRGTGRDPPAHRLHGPEPLFCLFSWRRHLHRQRSRHLDRGTGCRARLRRRVSAPLARQPGGQGPEDARRPAVRLRHGATALGPERGIFSRRRDPRLQCAHGLRPQQPRDVCDVDQSAHIGRRQMDVNGPSAENMGSDLRGITTDGFPIADRLSLVSAS